MNKKSLKLYLLIGYLVFNLIFLLVRFANYYAYFTTKPPLFLYHLISLVLAIAALACFFRREKGSWYLALYSVIIQPIGYSVAFSMIALSAVKGDSGLGEQLSLNYFALLYTIVGFAFTLLLFNRDILSRYTMEKVPLVGLVFPVIMIFILNLLPVLL